MNDIDEHLDRISKEAGLEVMADILGILYNRETVTHERLLKLTAEDVEDLYDRYVGPAIDDIEDAL